MTQKQLKRLERKLTEFLKEMTDGLGRPERRQAMAWYVSGLLLDGERKSIQPMAARLVTDTEETEAMRQRLQQCVVISGWDDDQIRERLAVKIDQDLPEIEALVIDDTGFPKKGKHSVGVARQYSGTLGRTDNCQVATSLHLAGEQGSAMIGMQLYLPKEWIDDRTRCRKAGIPATQKFQTKLEIAADLLDRASDWGIGKHIVLADAGYGNSREFRDGVQQRGHDYLMAVSGSQKVWSPGSNPKRPRKVQHVGRPSTRYRDGNRKPRSITEIAATLEYEEVEWRRGTRGMQRGWFSAVRIFSADGHTKRRPPSAEQWLLCEWPKGKDGPAKYYLSSLPPNTSLKELARVAKLRWRIERDYQELKGELGLDHFEGRTWRGFHHHTTLCAVAHGFLALHRALSPPEHSRKLDSRRRTTRPSADSDSTNRGLPAVPAALRSKPSAPRTLENVIK